MNDLNKILEQTIKSHIENEVDKLIENEVNEFKRRLLRCKNDYVATLMKCISIHEEEDARNFRKNYTITFINNGDIRCVK